jgi:hypothetical protein
MKKFIFLVIISAFIVPFAQSQDLPAPSSNLQTLPVGSYVVAMDNTNQGASGLMNIKAYGLVVTLLNNNVKVKWIINSTKVKDGIDFSVNATQIRPSLVSAANLSFKAGPFVIFAEDTTGVAAIVQTFNTAQSTNVRLYRTNATVSVDVRYDMTGFRPKAAILDDGTNADIHTGYMAAAGIPVTNFFVELTGANLQTQCYTFASEPHNTEANTTLINAIKSFVLNGGNFLAQCEAVRTYENNANGRFQTTGGSGLEKGAGGNSNATITTADVAFPNAALSYSQFEGAFNMNLGGSLRNWRLTTGTSYHNNAHDHVEGAVLSSAVSASVSKLTPANQRGGLVFYLGNHEYNLSNISNINGMRMYMNAFLTPTPNSGVISYTGNLSSCGNISTNRVVSLFAQNGPTGAFPIGFELYADVNSNNTIDGSDVSLGTSSVNTNNSAANIPVLNLAYRNNSYYLAKASTAPGCYANTFNFRIANTCGALPVTLVAFDARKTQDKVLLTWQTSLELDNDGFEIQRRFNGEATYQKIAFVEAKATQGTGASYSFTDANVRNKGSVSYRLAQTDLDGKISLSDIRVVNTGSGKSQMVVYPNPSKGSARVSLPVQSGKADITLEDFSGKTIQRWAGYSSNTLQLDQLRPGIYLIRVRVQETGEQLIDRLIVQ